MKRPLLRKLKFNLFLSFLLFFLWLWMNVGGCGWLWMVVGGYRWLRVVAYFSITLCNSCAQETQGKRVKFNKKAWVRKSSNIIRSFG